MRGLDTNVLIRFVTRDDLDQSEAARDLIEEAERSGEKLRLATAVLCELVWVLHGRIYRFDRPSIAAVLGRILETEVFAIQDRDLVRRALEDYRHGSADFSDYLIGWQNRDAGCADTVTFDRRLEGATGFTLL